MTKLKITTDDIRRELEKRRSNKIDSYFPETGLLRRELYTKNMEFFEATKDNREVTAMAANRVGKTETMGGYAVVCWATGNYPSWWNGKRFDKPVKILVAGETSKLVRDSIQLKLLGQLSERGTGLIRADDIIGTSPKQGIPNAVDQIFVKHKKGTSLIQFQSYDQGREVFQATEYDVVWFDEEPPLDIYAEGLIRTTTTKGIVISTFTPLKGMSQTVMSLREKAENGIGKIITATWDDAPHLSDEDKKSLWDSLPPHQRDARTKGIPALGSGAIYPIAEDFVFINDFEIPEYYRRAYGMDVGWNNTAACWGAYNPETDTWYITHDYKRGQAEPTSHAAAIKSMGEWIKGVIDPASSGSNQKDGTKLIEEYRQLGLHLLPADNAVESGLFEVYNRMVTGKLKIFNSCAKLKEEFRLYRRDDKGRVVKENDHIMDCLRYLIQSGLKVASVKKELAIFKGPGAYSSRYNGVYG